MAVLHSVLCEVWIWMRGRAYGICWLHLPPICIITFLTLDATVAFASNAHEQIILNSQDDLLQALIRATFN